MKATFKTLRMYKFVQSDSTIVLRTPKQKNNFHLIFGTILQFAQLQYNKKPVDQNDCCHISTPDYNDVPRKNLVYLSEVPISKWIPCKLQITLFKLKWTDYLECDYMTTLIAKITCRKLHKRKLEKLLSPWSLVADSNGSESLTYLLLVLSNSD